jgi:hypothetical protein
MTRKRSVALAQRHQFKRTWLMASALFALGACSEDGGGSGVLPGVQSMVFVKRAFITADRTHDVNGGSNQTIDYLRYEPGGGVYVLTPPTPDGELRDLTAGFEEVDINGIDLSFDATRVVFSMRRAGDPYYHLYLANVDGSGAVRQLTFHEAHDVKPLFVPGDRIAFMTSQPYTAMGTRADEYNHSRVVTQIATIDEATGDADRRLCSQNLSHSADPFLMSDGRIGFSRWEHLGPVNDVKLFAMNIDCSQMVAVAGQHDKPGNSLVQVTEVGAGQFVGIVTSRERTIQAGALYHIDARNLTGGSQFPYDEEHATFTALSPEVPNDEQSPATGVGRYRLPRPIPGTDRLLVSWSNGDVNDRNELAETAPNFGVYMFEPGSTERTLVYDDPAMWDLYAMPVAPRDAPPIRLGVVDPDADPYAPATIGSVDIGVTSLDETVETLEGGALDGLSLSDALHQAVAVRIVEGFSSEIGPIREFGLTMHEGAAIIGEAKVQEDGSWAARVPSLVPMHMQPIDRFGMAIRNQMLWIQAMPGEDRRCGGCHEDRTKEILPRSGAQTIAQQLGPEDFLRTIPERTEVPWAGSTSTRNVQDVLDEHCVSCHSGGDNDPFKGRTYHVDVTTRDGEMLAYDDLPYLDLSDRAIMVYYENEVHSYPASYVSLLYPSAMMSDSVATGDVPPQWVIPGSARQSPLIRAINVNAADDPGAWAWMEQVHAMGELDGMSREDRLILVRMVDLGGQYWSRKNVEGADAWGAAQY